MTIMEPENFDHPEPNQPDREDLDLLVSLYLSDELASDDRAAFEARLEDDLAACEALARGYELQQAVRAAFAEGIQPGGGLPVRRSLPRSHEVDQPHSFRSRREAELSGRLASSWRKTTILLLTGALAGLAFALIGRHWNQQPGGLRPDPANPDSAAQAPWGEADELALAWSAARGEIVPSESSEDGAESHDPTDRESTDRAAEISGGNLPSWMIAAIADRDPESEMDMEIDGNGTSSFPENKEEFLE